MAKLAIPSVHMNGTARQNLVDPLLDAMAAIRKVVEKDLREAYPNGRDYYPQGPSVINDAMHQHHSRVRRLMTVHDEYYAMVEAINANTVTSDREAAD